MNRADQPAGNPELNGGGGWGIFNALFGWTNSATYGSVLAYNLYWLAVIVAFACLGFYEKRGHWPLMKAKRQGSDAFDSDETSDHGDQGKSATVTQHSREVAA